jgi:hypothetical protein
MVAVKNQETKDSQKPTQRPFQKQDKKQPDTLNPDNFGATKGGKPVVVEEKKSH